MPHDSRETSRNLNLSNRLSEVTANNVTAQNQDLGAVLQRDGDQVSGLVDAEVAGEHAAGGVELREIQSAVVVDAEG